MAQEGKKISFGFSKSLKKAPLKSTVVQQSEKIDFIKCLDDQSIKVIGGGEEEKKNNVLVIPMKGGKTWHDRVLNKVDADIYEPKDKKNTSKRKINIKKEPIDHSENQNGNASVNDTPIDVSKIKQETENKPLSLDEMAAQEILLDSTKEPGQNEIKKDFTVPINDQADLVGAKESTLDDYENIPIEQYGLALLRGMGFDEAKHKDTIIINPEDLLRPKGMGLGADKYLKMNDFKYTKPKTKEEEELKLIVGAYVKILAGKYNHYYGQLEGFDEDAGRIIVKLGLTGNSVSLIASIVVPVTRTEYNKNAKVLNASQYEEHKNKLLKEESTKKNDNTSRIDLNKKSKKYDDDSSGSDRKSRRRKSSTDSEDNYREKKSKKKSKHHDRDSSKHSSKKSKKKDRERTRDRRDRSESPEKKKHSRKHKRSRS